MLRRAQCSLKLYLSRFAQFVNPTTPLGFIGLENVSAKTPNRGQGAQVMVLGRNEIEANAD